MQPNRPVGPLGELGARMGGAAPVNEAAQMAKANEECLAHVLYLWIVFKEMVPHGFKDPVDAMDLEPLFSPPSTGNSSGGESAGGMGSRLSLDTVMQGVKTGRKQQLYVSHSTIL